MRSLFITLFCIALCGCFKVREMQPSSIHLATNLRFASIRYRGNGRAILTIEVKDPKYDLRSLRPIPSSLRLVSDNGTSYHLCWNSNSILYNGTSYDASFGRNFYIAFEFTIFRNASATKSLAELPKGTYTFSVKFKGVSNVAPISATFKLQDEIHEFPDIKG